MALNGLKRVSKILQSKGSLINSTPIRFAGAWNEYWKPGPYPVTQEEREAAAAKYNLHPKDYQPYPDDGVNGEGDYPMLDPWSGASRHALGNYDHPEYRRDFGEPLHKDFDMYTMDRDDPDEVEQPGIHVMFMMFMAVMATGFATFYISHANRDPEPIKPLSYPEKGVIHYGFYDK